MSYIFCPLDSYTRFQDISLLEHGKGSTEQFSNSTVEIWYVLMLKTGGKWSVAVVNDIWGLQTILCLGKDILNALKSLFNTGNARWVLQIVWKNMILTKKPNIFNSNYMTFHPCQFGNFDLFNSCFYSTHRYYYRSLWCPSKKKVCTTLSTFELLYVKNVWLLGKRVYDMSCRQLNGLQIWS